MSLVFWIIALLAALGCGTCLGWVLQGLRIDGGSYGVQLVAAERRRQKRKGYTLDHDRLHMGIHGLGHLAGAGAAYTLRGIGNTTQADDLYTFADEMPPRSPSGDLPGPLQDLVDGAALIVAEIDLQQAVSTDFEARKRKEIKQAQRIDDMHAETARSLGRTEETLDRIEGASDATDQG